MIRHLWIFALLIGGCGGGMQAIEKLPSPPPQPAIVSGTYIFTLSGYPEGLGSQLQGPILTMTFTQGQWQNGIAPLHSQRFRHIKHDLEGGEAMSIYSKEFTPTKDHDRTACEAWVAIWNDGGRHVAIAAPTDRAQHVFFVKAES